jgi:uncharacterized protein YfaS (alpha-2-macroglobulin family)
MRPLARLLVTRFMVTSLCLSFLAVSFLTTPTLAEDVPGGPREAQWKKVAEAMKKGLPKTAIAELKPIVEGALKDKAYAEYIKALSQTIALEGNIQGNKPEEKLIRMKAELKRAPQEIVPVLDAVLANWYWHYFQQNRWRIMQRTQTSNKPDADFQTWDLSRLLAEVDKQFGKALSRSAVLKTIKVEEYASLLNKGNVPDTYRPTMYDFIAHNALEFYSTGEQAGARATNAFDLMADSPVFSSVDEFLKWELKSNDKSSSKLKALKLYQQLIAFHLKDKDNTALLDANLWRLHYAKNNAFGEDKNSRYKTALKRFVDANEDHRIASRAIHEWASVIQGEGELVKAHQLAHRGLKLHPNSIGANRCHNLIEQIESKSSSIQAERVWNEPIPKINVSYRNLNKVYFRAVKSDWSALMKRRTWQPEYLNDAERRQISAKKPAMEWNADLPATEDFKQRNETLKPPKGLEPGFYFLISSHRADFSGNANMVSMTDFWVSDLALITRLRYGNGKLEGFVLNAISGDPIAGAKIAPYIRANNNQWTLKAAAQTDANGKFSFNVERSKQYRLLATHKGLQIATSRAYNNYGNNNQPRPYSRTIFFTDRAIYRPGQTVHFKGICINVNQQTDNYETLANVDVVVQFRDRNGKEVAVVKTRSNDYGSISGSFTAPRDRLMGNMSLVNKSGPPGNVAFSVEEYKRPKFQVTMEKPEEAFKLNGNVEVTGKAMAYTGAAIDHAKVRYRVVRQVRYPSWWGAYYWWRPRNNNSQEIAHGSVETAANGSFKVTFVAKPDLSVNESDEPSFDYTIYADVTDTTGETRSSQVNIRIGYTAIQAHMSTASWLTDVDPVEVGISTSTLDGVPQSADVVVKIHRLRAPATVQRPKLSGGYHRYGGQKPPADLSNPNSWELGEVVHEQGVSTGADGVGSIKVKLPAGHYRAMLQTQDKFGKLVKAQLPLQVIDPDAKKCVLKIPFLMAGPKSQADPGETFSLIWGSGYAKARAFVEVEHRGKILQQFWTAPNVTQHKIEQQIDESMRGGLNLRITMVRENRAYMKQQYIGVPWTNKQLTVKWEHFVSKLAPGEKETWTAVISGPDAEKSVAEMVATLYDASLDTFRQHNWMSSFNVFRYDQIPFSSHFANTNKGLGHILGQFPRSHRNGSLYYRKFPNEIRANLSGFAFKARNRNGIPTPSGPMADAQMAQGQQTLGIAAAAPGNGQAKRKAAKSAPGGNGSGPAGPNLDKVAARKNLNETAFFFPHLMSAKDGTVRLEFQMPEALTEWKFIGFAHDKELRGGAITGTTVTAKDLMVQPNPPRFVREGDVLEFTVKVSNQSPTRQKGKVRLSFADARTAAAVDKSLGNMETDLEFDIPSKESQSLSWRINVPDEMGFLTYKAVGSTGRLSDGEEGFLPVLSRRILVTESLPLPIRDAGQKTFDFTKLKKSGDSDSLKHQSLTVQMVSNPSWYAVLALPYLMEYPHQCAEQTFNRLYANELARHIVKSDPKIRRIFDQWKGTDALDSPLEKNQDLKAVMLEETPWLRQANNESQARRNVGILFDDNRLNEEVGRAMNRIKEMQGSDGLWPWFPGGRGNFYMSLYITTGFGRMRHLGVDTDVSAAIKALNGLDAEIEKRYRQILKNGHPERNHMTPSVAFYLYGRSFFLEDKPIAAKHKEAVNYFLGQAKKYWLELAVRQSQGHLAIATKRFGDEATAKGIMASIKERSVSNEEMGMFWRELELSWWWFRAPIETQALMIEAFDEVMDDTKSVDDCKVWLLKQKQTQDWKTTKATADAVYALLLRGDNLLASDALVEVSLAGQKIKPQNVEAGTGFYEQRFLRGEIKPEMGNITVKKVDKGVAWGAVHWQYLEDMSKITPYKGTPLTLEKQLYNKVYTDAGPQLQPVKGPVKVGDEIVVRVVLRVDRDMEYVHMKDYRGSGTEPVNVLSRYKYQDGLGYYESTRDTASHFFIDYLPKGTYVFEYSTRAVHRGEYQTGICQIQCMYAPEFNSHSESLPLEVK